MPAIGLGCGVALVGPPAKQLPRPPQGSAFVTVQVGVQPSVQPVTSGGKRVTARIS